MGDKLIETRFTIQFSNADPAHIQAADLLNRQGRRSKAQYLVNAILFYENNVNASSWKPAPPEIDIEMIEEVVRRLLGDIDNTAKAKPKPTPKTHKTAKVIPGAESFHLHGFAYHRFYLRLHRQL